jgi:hypothetical protein
VSSTADMRCPTHYKELQHVNQCTMYVCMQIGLGLVQACLKTALGKAGICCWLCLHCLHRRMR